MPKSAFVATAGNGESTLEELEAKKTTAMLLIQDLRDLAMEIRENKEKITSLTEEAEKIFQKSDEESAAKLQAQARQLFDENNEKLLLAAKIAAQRFIYTDAVKLCVGNSQLNSVICANKNYWMYLAQIAFGAPLLDTRTDRISTMEHRNAFFTMLNIMKRIDRVDAYKSIEGPSYISVTHCFFPLANTDNTNMISSTFVAPCSVGEQKPGILVLREQSYVIDMFFKIQANKNWDLPFGVSKPAAADYWLKFFSVYSSGFNLYILKRKTDMQTVGFFTPYGNSSLITTRLYSDLAVLHYADYSYMAVVVSDENPGTLLFYNRTKPFLPSYKLQLDQGNPSLSTELHIVGFEAAERPNFLYVLYQEEGERSGLILKINYPSYEAVAEFPFDIKTANIVGSAFDSDKKIVVVLMANEERDIFVCWQWRSDASTKDDNDSAAQFTEYTDIKPSEKTVFVEVDGKSFRVRDKVPSEDGVVRTQRVFFCCDNRPTATLKQQNLDSLFVDITPFVQDEVFD